MSTEKQVVNLTSQRFDRQANQWQQDGSDIRLKKRGSSFRGDRSKGKRGANWQPICTGGDCRWEESLVKASARPNRSLATRREKRYTHAHSEPVSISKQESLSRSATVPIQPVLDHRWGKEGAPLSPLSVAASRISTLTRSKHSSMRFSEIRLSPEPSPEVFKTEGTSSRLPFSTKADQRFKFLKSTRKEDPRSQSLKILTTRGNMVETYSALSAPSSPLAIGSIASTPRLAAPRNGEKMPMTMTMNGKVAILEEKTGQKEEKSRARKLLHLYRTTSRVLVGALPSQVNQRVKYPLNFTAQGRQIIDQPRRAVSTKKVS